MPVKRPTIISVIGILNIVFGSLGLVTTVCCGGVGLIATKYMGEIQLPQQPGKVPGPNPFAEMSKLNDLPGYFVTQVGGIAMAALTGTLLIVSGIGFLKMKQWGRMVALAYAVIGIIWAIVVLIIQITILGPAMAEFNKNLQAQMGQTNPFAGNPAFQNIGFIMGMVFAFAYPITMLVLMLLPAIKDALGGKGAVIRDDGDELAVNPDLDDTTEQ